MQANYCSIFNWDFVSNMPSRLWGSVMAYLWRNNSVKYSNPTKYVLSPKYLYVRVKVWIFLSLHKHRKSYYRCCKLLFWRKMYRKRNWTPKTFWSNHPYLCVLRSGPVNKIGLLYRLHSSFMFFMIDYCYFYGEIEMLYWDWCRMLCGVMWSGGTFLQELSFWIINVSV